MKVRKHNAAIILFIAIAFLIVLASTATYFATKHYVFANAYGKGQVVGAKTGYTKGTKKGYQTGWSDAVKLFDTGTHGCDSTPTANDQLGCLPAPKQSQSAPAATYTSPAPAPNPSTSLHCTSSSLYYSNTTYTDCY
jgi:hypothetical protein